jgi:hypothetical protein
MNLNLQQEWHKCQIFMYSFFKGSRAYIISQSSTLDPHSMDLPVASNLQHQAIQTVPNIYLLHHIYIRRKIHGPQGHMLLVESINHMGFCLNFIKEITDSTVQKYA